MSSFRCAANLRCSVFGRDGPNHQRSRRAHMQVPKGANEAQLKRAYRKLALQYHPVGAAD